jgi:IS30 family transposase
VLAAHIGDLQASIGFLEDRHDLALGESAFLHWFGSVIPTRTLSFQTVPCEGKLTVRLRALESKEAEVVQRGLVDLLRKDMVLSLTYDRGLEWTRHEDVAGALGAVSYFCRPYHSWEKGGVENMNGLLRRYLPRGIAFPHEEVDHEWIQEVETEVNGRPRRMHGYRTPAEVSEARRGPAI